MITGVNHAQVNVPSDKLDEARRILHRRPRHERSLAPAVFTSKGIWLNAGTFELHIGTEDNVERKTRGTSGL